MNDLRTNSAMDTWRKSILFISMIVMFTGLLFSRAILSSALIVFVATCLVHKNILDQLKTFLSSTFLLSMSLLFLLPLISGLWSEDLSQWSQIIRIKLPLLLLPICFAGINNFKSKTWEKVAFAFLILIFSGICRSLWQYLQNWESIHAGSFSRNNSKQYCISPCPGSTYRFNLFLHRFICFCYKFIEKQ